MNYDIEKIINIANELQRTGSTAASTSERIAAAFVLNRMEYLPDMYSNVVEAWERLDNWQGLVKRIHREYMHLIEGQ